MKGTPASIEKSLDKKNQRDVHMDSSMRQSVIVYSLVLLTVYVSAWLIKSHVDISIVISVVMFAPLVAALCASFVSRASIQWGYPDWWLLVSLMSVAAPLFALLMMALLGIIELSFSILMTALVHSPVVILISCITAFGEEIGWRGFLWPMMRKRFKFLPAAGYLGSIWILYHLPFIFSGDYGSLSGLPAFLIAIVGFTLFVGVLTDRSRSVWPAILSHGAWNALVATSFRATVNNQESAAFSGNNELLGEFGWIPAAAMFIVGLSFTTYHLARGHGKIYAKVPAQSVTK